MNFEEELAKVSKKREKQESLEHQKLSLEQEHKELCVDFKLMKREKEELIEGLKHSNKDIAKLQREKLDAEIELERYKKKYEERPIKEVEVEVEVPQKYTERRLELLEKYLKPTKFFIFLLLFIGIIMYFNIPTKTANRYKDVEYKHNIRKYERQYNKWLSKKQNLNEEYQFAQNKYDNCVNGIALGCSKDYLTGEVDPEDLAPRQAKIDQKADEIKQLENNEPVKPQKIQ